MSSSTDPAASPDEGGNRSTTSGDLPERPGTIARRVGGKALPLYLSMLSTVAGNAVTAGVMGTTGTVELAAYALVIAVFTPTLMLVQGALRGSMPFVAQNEDSARSLAPVLRDSLWLALFMGGAGGALIAAVPALSRLIGVAEPTVAALGTYPILMALYTLITSTKNAMMTLLVGLGHTRTVMVVSLCTTGVALTLTPALVLGPGPVPTLGLPGAGVAMLSTGALTILPTWWAVRRTTVLRGHRIGLGPPRWSGVGRMAAVGLPSGSTLLLKSGTVSVLTVVVARIGPEEVAVHQLVVVLLGMAFIPAVAVGQATVPFTARAAKSGRRALVRRTVLSSYLVSLPVVLLGTAALWLFPTQLLGLFSDDVTVREGVAALVPLLTLVVVFDAVQSAPNLGLLGIKDTRPAMYAYVFCYGALVSLSVPLAERAGLGGLWTAYAATTLVLATVQWGSFLVVSRKAVVAPT
ncbi:MATE family efflux transporter [Nocardiopsis alkaliphila]|uniref:MATE family efflux transporter n=1 Tax=Nocardiopsis alkaliphila TaxID=225762 RepID=UPI0003497192|nr:MATE family efflux transporter [Nocardiopsis alkaliphila]